MIRILCLGVCTSQERETICSVHDGCGWQTRELTLRRQIENMSPEKDNTPHLVILHRFYCAVKEPPFRLHPYTCFVNQNNHAENMSLSGIHIQFKWTEQRYKCYLTYFARIGKTLTGGEATAACTTTACLVECLVVSCTLLDTRPLPLSARSPENEEARGHL